MEIRVNLVLIFGLLLISCSGNRNKTNQNIKAKMELMVLSNYGAEEKIISESTTVDQIEETMNKINWNEFHQVVLSTDNSNWIEVGGNLNEDGLSAIYEENGHQFVINEPPSSVNHMMKILVSYYNGDGKFKKENKFE